VRPARQPVRSVQQASGHGTLQNRPGSRPLPSAFAFGRRSPRTRANSVPSGSADAHRQTQPGSPPAAAPGPIAKRTESVRSLHLATAYDYPPPPGVRPGVRLRTALTSGTGPALPSRQRATAKRTELAPRAGAIPSKAAGPTEGSPLAGHSEPLTRRSRDCETNRIGGACRRHLEQGRRADRGISTGRSQGAPHPQEPRLRNEPNSSEASIPQLHTTTLCRRARAPECGFGPLSQAERVGGSSPANGRLRNEPNSSEASPSQYDTAAPAQTVHGPLFPQALKPPSRRSAERIQSVRSPWSTVTYDAARLPPGPGPQGTRLDPGPAMRQTRPFSPGRHRPPQGRVAESCPSTPPYGLWAGSEFPDKLSRRWRIDR
jgi:hypothetical protein